MKRLQDFWNNPNCPTKFKLQVYDAVIRSKLVYGLESVELTAGQIRHLNAFQLKSIRRILKMKTTFVERENTNKNVRCGKHNQKPANVQNKNMLSFSECIHKQQNQLLAHIIRAPDDDPLRECTLAPVTALPFSVNNRRVGRPKNNWTFKTYERLIYKNIPMVRQLWKSEPEVYINEIRPLVMNRNVHM